YAKFKNISNRNETIFNPEDRDKWYSWGEKQEIEFVKIVVPFLKRDIQINPEKKLDKTKPDLYDYSTGTYADLKRQTTPFFTAGKYLYESNPYDASNTVTFKTDY